jgi:hypothetical protein
MAKLSEISNSRVAVIGADSTKWVDDSVLQVLSASSSLTNKTTGVTYAEAMAYKDSSGKYSLRFRIKSAIGGVGSMRFAFTGVTLTGQEISFDASHTNDVRTVVSSRTETSTNNFYVQVDTPTAGDIVSSGDIQLASRPSWFDANLETEGGLPVATDTSRGIDFAAAGGGLTQLEAAADPAPATLNSSYLITGAFSTFTLPAIPADGRIVYLKRGAGADFETTPMTITPNGADTVDGDSTVVWDSNSVDLIILTSNGTDWEMTTTISPSAVIGTSTEYVEGQADAQSVALSGDTWTEITSVTLSAGTWDISWSLLATSDTGFPIQYAQGGVSTTSAATPGGIQDVKKYNIRANGASSSTIAGQETYVPVPGTTYRETFATPTTLYLNLFISHQGTGGGFISARKV